MNPALTEASAGAGPSNSHVAATDPALDDTGLSALRLLAPPGASARFAIVPRPGIAEISAGTPTHGKRLRVSFARGGPLPFGERSLDGLIIDLDRLSLRGSRTIAEWSAEIRRVLRPGGWCVAAVSHRRMARDRRALLQYRLVPPSRTWCDAFQKADLRPCDTARLSFDGERLTHIFASAQPQSGGSTSESADAAAIVAFAAGPASAPHSSATPPSVLAGLVGAIGECLGDHTGQIEQTFVRKIGKTVCTMRTAKGGLLLRVPRSTIAERRAINNFTALERLHNDDPRWNGIRELVPAPIARGTCGEYSFFAETMMPGRPRKQTATHLVWERQALELLVASHRASRTLQRIDSDVFRTHLGVSLDTISTFVDPGHQSIIDRLRARLWTDLSQRELPFVSAHGDFTGENCLYDDHGRLCAVIDWELFRPVGLPLHDVLQCMDVPGEDRTSETWLRADIVLDAAAGRGPLARAAVLQRYLDEMALPAEVLPSLLLAYWVDHVGVRIAARRGDATWMQKRVLAPLRRIGAML